MQQPVNSNE
jgi:hypothetical protein